MMNWRHLKHFGISDDDIQKASNNMRVRIEDKAGPDASEGENRVSVWVAISTPGNVALFSCHEREVMQNWLESNGYKQVEDNENEYER